jgi:hypothetical protein
MKKTNISFAYDEEKLSAVKMFMAQKEAELEAELAGFMESLYKKYVPSGVREYIELMDGQAGREKEKRKQPQRAQPQAGSVSSGSEVN